MGVRCGPTLVIACGLLACAARPLASGQPSVETPASPSVTPAARPSIVADRGVAVGTQGVWVIAAWRADVDARGVLVVLPRPGASAAELAALANRSLDVGFNHAHVEATERPLALQIKVASILAADKMLGHRQRLEQGRTQRPGITALWLDDHGPGRALNLLRAALPHGVHAAIVVTREGPPRRRMLLRAAASALHVLEIAAPAGVPVDDATWAEVSRFLDEVEAERLRARAMTPDPPENGR